RLAPGRLGAHGVAGRWGALAEQALGWQCLRYEGLARTCPDAHADRETLPKPQVWGGSLPTLPERACRALASAAVSPPPASHPQGGVAGDDASPGDREVARWRGAEALSVPCVVPLWDRAQALRHPRSAASGHPVSGHGVAETSPCQARCPPDWARQAGGSVLCAGNQQSARATP